jgi:hypothetical protein
MAIDRPKTPDEIKQGLPIWLKRTPAQEAGDRALQDRLRQAAGPGVHPNPTERHLLRAAAVERSARAHLEHLRVRPHTDPAHVKNAEAQLAEAWASQGKYSEAAELHPSPAHAARFAAIAAAIERDDDAPGCGCPIEREKDPAQGGREVTIPPDNIDEIIYSPKHRKLMPLVVCKCGDMNVKAAPAHLEERLNRALATHRAAVKEARK